MSREAKGEGYISGKPDVAFWLKNVRKGIEFRKKKAYQDMWDIWRKYYRGEFQDRVLPYNIFFMALRTIVPRVYFRNPSISITQAKPGIEYALLAQILERVDNKLLVQMKVKQQIKKQVQDAFMFGTGIGKLGFGSEYSFTPDLLDTQDPRTKKGYRLEYNDLIFPNMPWYLRTKPEQFIVPDGCEDVSEARWVAHWMQRPIWDVKDDPRLENTTLLSDVRRGPREYGLSTKSSPEGMCDLIEIRDKRAGKVIIIYPYGEDTKRVGFFEDDELLFEGRFPYYPLVFNNDDEHFWGIPDAKILDSLQREMNETRTLIMKHRRLSIRKFISEAGAMDPDEEAKLVDVTDVGAVAHTAANKFDKVKTMEIGDIPNGLLKAMAEGRTDVQEILGLGQNQWGEYVQGSEKPSATEASIVNMASQIRTDERRDTTADMLVDIVKGVNNVIMDRWQESQVVDIAGPGGVRIWVRFAPEQLRRGAYNLAIDPDSSLPETKDKREAKAVATYNLLVQNPLIDQSKLTNMLLRELHGYQYDDIMRNSGAALTPGLTQNNPIEMPALMQKMPQLLQIAQQK